MKEDIRVLRTRQRLEDALYELVDAIGFEKITVTSLVNKACINRNTFYLHYKDKYDLLSKIEDRVLDELDHSLDPLPAAMMKSLRIDDMNDEVVKVFTDFYNAIYKNSRYFNTIPIHENHTAFWARLATVLKEHIHAGYPKDLFRIPLQYYDAVIVGIQTGLIREWATGGLKEKPEELVDVMIMILRGLAKSVFIKENTVSEDAAAPGAHASGPQPGAEAFGS